MNTEKGMNVRVHVLALAQQPVEDSKDELPQLTFDGSKYTQWFERDMMATYCEGKFA